MSLRVLTPARAGGLLGMLAAGLILKLATGSSTFGLDRIDQSSLRWTGSDAVLASVAIPLGTNVFQIRTGPIEAALATIPTVESAHVSIALPSTLDVTVVERTPILAWRMGEARYLVDDSGLLFAAVDAKAVSDAKIPTVSDLRPMSPLVLFVGNRLDPVDLDVATRLGALLPTDLGSAGTRLTVRVDDTDGFTVQSVREPWTAIFGFYSRALRSPDIIPGQVQLLRSLLAGREAKVDQVILANATTGTYTLRSSAQP